MWDSQNQEPGLGLELGGPLAYHRYQICVLSSSGEDFVTVAFSGSLIVRFSGLSTRGALPGVPPRILGSSFLPKMFRMDTEMSRLPHPS